MFDIPRIAAGLLLSATIGWLAYRRGSLTRGGWLGAIITGTTTFGLGGWAWGLTLIAFFVSSSALSHFRRAAKERIAGEKFEKGERRDLGQALANGGAGAVLAIGYAALGAPPALLAAYVGALATVTADTWATELGVLSPHRPRLITTLRPAEPGTSGGITIHGTLASAAGALFIGVAALVLTGLEVGVWWSWLPLAALVGGMAGSLLDSLLGATLQAMYRAESGETERRTSRAGVPNTLIRGLRWMTNDAVNFVSSLAGAALAALVAGLLGA